MNTQRKKHQKFGLKLLLLVVAVIIVFAGWYALQKYNKMSEQAESLGQDITTIQLQEAEDVSNALYILD